MKVNQSFLNQTKSDFSRDLSFKKSFDLGKSKQAAGMQLEGGATMPTMNNEAPINILEMSNKPRKIKGGQKRPMNEELKEVMEPAII